MKNLDLFGGETESGTLNEFRYESHYQRFKRVNNYRKSVSADKCKSCISHRSYNYHDKTYHKCVLIGESHSTATDIQISSVCDKFSK